MNERIRELAVEARRYYLTLPTGYSPEQVGMYQELMEKFAELIIRECVASIPSNGHRGDFGRAVEFCQQQIKQHFGIAE